MKHDQGARHKLNDYVGIFVFNSVDSNDIRCNLDKGFHASRGLFLLIIDPYFDPTVIPMHIYSLILIMFPVKVIHCIGNMIKGICIKYL
ncbi:hypothetical protein A1QC_05790 [Vibrio rumoiensis 1S-45]|uniref:Uncharacterized protein n=1 Tax=Vibrio rumoiensis 1S-45 TaxID=1188252 RepID=A0A1E5E4V0_9VIBR|nr:hypothetical protein A1QC_05790 [Vibrio rumoiensis 1S-45]